MRGADRPGVIGARLGARAHRGASGAARRAAGPFGEAEDLEKVGAAFAAEGVRALGPFPTAALRRVLGRRRVSGAIIDRDGRDRRAAADVVVFGDRTPNLDLVLAAGAAVELRDGILAPVLDEAGRTTVPGLSVVGSAAGRVGAAHDARRSLRRPVGPSSASARTSTPTRSMRRSLRATATRSSSSAGPAR